MSDTEDICELCAGSGEVVITPIGEDDGQAGTYGCPICIAKQRDELLAEIDAKAESGLCYFALQSAREFLKDIHRLAGVDKEL